MELKPTKITTANTTTVPAVIRRALKVKAGEFVEWCIENNQVIVRKAEAKK